ncbi:MAG TPA: OmpA family protein [Chitinophagaceae bacterium]|nr:OmpA family protein [Chitinophagaceae bacterium]
MKFLIIQLFIFLSLSSFSQNLLVNGGFEDENICTEFHVNCAPEGWIATADTYNNFFKIPSLAHSGLHCVAIEAGNSKRQFSRTYIRSQLLCALRKGNKYRITFYIKSRHDILDSVGIYFTHYDFLFEKQLRYRIIASKYVADAVKRPAKGDTNWKKIAIDYVASGNEEYITLGNFSKKDITGPTGIPTENHFFVFLDDISLTPEDRREKICAGWKETRNQIYAFDARHQMLDVYVRRYINNPPQPPPVDRTIVHKVEKLIIPDILFEVDKDKLNQRSFGLLDSLCMSLLNEHVDSIVIEGHTDNTGTIAHNEKLSQDRALAVGDYIHEKLLLHQNIITSRGWGSVRPVADNNTAEGRQLNRRVEIFIYIRE